MARSLSLRILLALFMGAISNPIYAGDLSSVVSFAGSSQTYIGVRLNPFESLFIETYPRVYTYTTSGTSFGATVLLGLASPEASPLPTWVGGADVSSVAGLQSVVWHLGLRHEARMSPRTSIGIEGRVVEWTPASSSLQCLNRSSVYAVVDF